MPPIARPVVGGRSPRPPAVRDALARWRGHPRSITVVAWPMCTGRGKSPRTCLRINAIGTHHVLDAAAEIGLTCRILVTCSALVYLPSSEPLNEAHPLNPTSPYGIICHRYFPLQPNPEPGVYYRLRSPRRHPCSGTAPSAVPCNSGTREDRHARSKTHPDVLIMRAAVPAN